MTSAQTISLRLDTQAAERALARLLAELESRSDLVQAFLKPLDSLPELFSIDLEQLPAGGAIHLRAVLQPTDFLRELVLAIGAGDVDLLLVESCAHGGSHVE
jgi:hypothetical protein